MTRKEAESILPSEPTQSQIDPSNLCVVLIAIAKWGKTKFFMSNPDALLLAFEEGHKFQRGSKLRIAKWDMPKRQVHKITQDREGVRSVTAMQALDVLEHSSKFNFVIIDTVDMAAKMCSDYHCEKFNVSSPSEISEYGQGWAKAITDPMRKFVLRILKTGRGVGIITHTKIELMRYTSGEKARKEMSVSGGVARFIATQADVIAHGELGKKRAGMRLRDRILVCEGDMDTLAGNRSGTMLPERYIVDPENPWAQFHRFFLKPTAADRADAQYKKLYKGSK